MSKTEKTEPETPTTDSPDAGGGETILDKRVTVLETEMKHLATKADLKYEIGEVKAEIAEIREILKHVATKEDMQILKYVATKEDIQRQRVWILSGAIGVVFTLVLIGLGAYRILVG